MEYRYFADLPSARAAYAKDVADGAEPAWRYWEHCYRYNWKWMEQQPIFSLDNDMDNYRRRITQETET